MASAARKSSLFDRFAKRAASLSGRPATFILAMLAVVLWACSGPLFGYSDTWQLVINTSTTIITFLMVFLIQSTQNRDTGAMQVKLDELIRSTHGAKNMLLDLEEMNEADLEALRAEYECLAEKARKQKESRRKKRAS